MKRRAEPAVLISVALHLVVGAVLMQALMHPGSLPGWLRRDRSAKPVEERITYVLVTPRARAGEPSPPARSGGDGRPEEPRSTPRPARPLPVPGPVTRGIPEPARSADTGRSGPITETPGPVRGVAPTYADPRVWAPPGAVVVAPKTPVERMDSLVASGIQRYNDSVAVAAAQRKPGDWTVSRNGKRYGLDRGRLVLGDLSIPIPFALQAPPGQDMERDRVMARVRQEIELQSRRAMNEEEFRLAVRRIRERKERERANRREGVGGDVVAAPPD